MNRQPGEWSFRTGELWGRPDRNMKQCKMIRLTETTLGKMTFYFSMVELDLVVSLRMRVDFATKNSNIVKRISKISEWYSIEWVNTRVLTTNQVPQRWCEMTVTIDQPVCGVYSSVRLDGQRERTVTGQQTRNVGSWDRLPGSVWTCNKRVSLCVCYCAGWHGMGERCIDVSSISYKISTLCRENGKNNNRRHNRKLTDCPILFVCDMDQIAYHLPVSSFVLASHVTLWGALNTDHHMNKSTG